MIEYRRIRDEDYKQLPQDILWPSDGVVAVEDGQVVALAGLVPMLHLDPIWLREDKRHSPFLLRRLWVALKQRFLETGFPYMLGFAHRSDPTICKLSEWAGGIAIPGTTYAFKKE